MQRDSMLVYVLPIAANDQKCGWVLMAVACCCLATATVETPAAPGPNTDTAATQRRTGKMIAVAL